MSYRKIWFYFSLIVLLLTATLLIIGSSILTIPLDANNSVPLGTFITWIGIMALPFNIYWGVKELRNPTEPFYNYLAIIINVLFVLSILWLPICYLLSGNISFSFSEKETFQGGQLAMKWFWSVSYGVVLGPILLLAIYWIYKLLKKRK